MIELNDWRLQGQEKYLKGVTLFFRYYSESKFPDWNHDHCEFCWTTFSLAIDDALKVGYTTEDTYRWICPKCFEDFKELFVFKVGNSPISN